MGHRNISTTTIYAKVKTDTLKKALTKEQIKEFKEVEKKAEDFDDFRNVADDIAEAGEPWFPASLS